MGVFKIDADDFQWIGGAEDDPQEPKELPENEIDRSGYIAFWNEWRRRRGCRQASN